MRLRVRGDLVRLTKLLELHLNPALPERIFTNMQNNAFRKVLARLIAVLTVAVLSASVLSSCSKEPYEDYDLRDHILIGAYSEITVTDSELEAKLEEYRAALLNSKVTTTRITDRRLIKGDVAVVDYVCKQVGAADGEAPLLSDVDCNIVIGEWKYFRELENALRGAYFDKPFKVNVSVPADHSLPKLAGKNVEFTVVLKDAYSMKLPEYNDAFISENTEYSTVAEYEQAIYGQVLQDVVWEKLIESSDVLSYPHNEVNECSLDFIEYYTALANSSSVTLEEYVARKFFIDATQFHLKADEYAKKLVKEKMAVYSIARNNSLELTDAEYNEAALKYAEKYGYRNVSELEGQYGAAFVKYTVLKDKVMKYVTEQSFAWQTWSIPADGGKH